MHLPVVSTTQLPILTALRLYSESSDGDDLIEIRPR